MMYVIHLIAKYESQGQQAIHQMSRARRVAEVTRAAAIHPPAIIASLGQAKQVTRSVETAARTTIRRLIDEAWKRFEALPAGERLPAAMKVWANDWRYLAGHFPDIYRTTERRIAVLRSHASITDTEGVT